jgi:hypothetical protein
LCVLTVFANLPVSFGGALPIGKVVTTGVVSVGESKTPSGTVLFSGERIAAEEAAALVTFREGGSVLLNEGAAATFSRDGELLLIRADRGSINFNFLPGEEVRIQTGSREYVSSKSGVAGEISVNAAGEPVVLVARGEATSLGAQESGAAKGGKGNLTKGGNTFTDPAARWPVNKLQGSRLVINGRQYQIVSNTENTIKVDAAFTLDTGSYSYFVTAPIVKTGMSSGKKAAIGLAVAGGATGGIIAITRKSD